MKRGWGIRLMGFLAAAVLMAAALCPRAFADEYDKNYPELLSEGHLTAASAILIEADSGRVIFEKNPDERMYPASTTKILTVWLALMLGDSLEDGMETKLVKRFKGSLILIIICSVCFRSFGVHGA